MVAHVAPVAFGPARLGSSPGADCSIGSICERSTGKTIDPTLMTWSIELYLCSIQQYRLFVRAVVVAFQPPR